MSSVDESFRQQESHASAMVVDEVFKEINKLNRTLECITCKNKPFGIAMFSFELKR